MNRIHRNATQRRSGFTLIELLVVIAIIAILASLLMAGVMMFLRKGPEIENKNAMLQINTGLQKFKTEYGRYPPSLFRVRAKLADYNWAGADQLDRDSAAFLAFMFRTLPPGTSVPWAGSTAIPPTPGGGIILEGDQCLVFFLGGPPNSGIASAGLMGGFSTDPANPATVSGSASRKKSMDFPTGRLINRQTAAYPAGHPFPSFVDAYGQEPFIYFSSNNRPNGYQTGPMISLAITPYSKTAPPSNQFHNPDTYQLISAGADMKWGPGGQWAPGSATGTGADDLSNFHDKVLGVQ